MRRILLPALMALCACAEPARSEPAVWRIRDADSTIILFGSFHLLPEGVDWRPKALTQALSQTDDLWFEIPVDGAVNSQLQAQIQAHALLPPGESLLAQLSSQGRTDLSAVAQTINLPIETFDRLQPWYAETILGMAVYRQQGALPEEGVEQQIARIAPARAQRRALESADAQIKMLAKGDRAAQIASLEHSLHLFQSDPGYFDRVMAFWLNGDAKGLDREVLGEMRQLDPEQYETLIVDRNRAWVPLIEARLRGSGQTVMVVGVGHLVGKDGVPALLRADGISVDGP